MKTREYVCRVRLELTGERGEIKRGYTEPFNVPLRLRQVAANLNAESEIDIRVEEYRLTQTFVQVAAVEKFYFNYLLSPGALILVEVKATGESGPRDVLLKCEISEGY